VGVAQVHRGEHDEGQREEQAQQQVPAEHPLVELVLERLARGPLGHRDAREVHAVDDQDREEPQHD
jgi:hypothetical protein